MNNEELIRGLIKGSIHRAIQETVAALVVVVAFAAILQRSEGGSPMHYGCLLILVAMGFILGVVWSYALSYRLLRTHPASDVGFWREAFHAQAKLLRLVPLWYCGPIFAAATMFVAPTQRYELLPFLIIAAVFAVVLAGTVWLNRRAAAKIERAATQLTAA